MTKKYFSNVLAAFEVLLEEIEAEIDSFGRIAANASGNREYEKAKDAIEHAKLVTVFRDRVVELRRDWNRLAPGVEEEKDIEVTNPKRQNFGRLPRGLRTREEEFYLPLLKTLVNLGGSGQMADVLAGVEQLMKDQLKDVDYEPLASDSHVLRWRNTAQWARNELVKEELLKADSPRGVWEISERGRAKLAQL